MSGNIRMVHIPCWTSYQYYLLSLDSSFLMQIYIFELKKKRKKRKIERREKFILHNKHCIQHNPLDIIYDILAYFNVF